MNIQKLSFWQRWLSHSALVWLVINLVDIIVYLYYAKTLTVYGITVRDFDMWHNFLNHNLYQTTPILILVILLLVELNNYIFYNKKIGAFIAGSLGTGIAAILFMSVFDRLLDKDIPFSLSLFPHTYWLISAYAFVYPLVLAFISKRIFRGEGLYEHSSAELHALKAQVHPHFLFNTLNSLYGTALAENAPHTASSIEKLANLMRYILHETSREEIVPVQKEIEFLKEYIGLQRMRLPEEIDKEVLTDISFDGLPCMIAPLLLLPFVENAFTYGISINHPCYVRLQLSVKNQQLFLQIKNGMNGNSKGSGTGLQNARKRLELLYPGKHTIEITRTAHEYQVLLTIQLQ